MRTRLGHVLRIARAEVASTAGTIDARSIGIALVVGGVLLAGLVGAVVGGDVGLDEGLYRVGVDGDAPLAAAVDADPTFTRMAPERRAIGAGDLELLVEGDRLLVHDSPKGRAAAAELRASVRRYNDRRMATEDDAAAAFPVVVTLTYAERDPGSTGTAGDGDGSGTDPSRNDGGGEPATGSGSSVTDPTDRIGNDVGGAGGLGGRLPDAGALVGAEAGASSGPPGTISPPFPFRSLLLAFAFVVPMNFVIQAYGSRLMRERVGRRGELLLVSPATPASIVAGLTLPYLAVLAAIVVGLAAALGGGYLAIAAVLPVAVLFLGATFLAALVARSFKELTFLTVTISVLLTTYLFVPAIFTEVGPIATISPLTLVVRDLQGSSVGIVEYLFATGPVLFAGLALFVLGLGIYREEDLFTQRSLRGKAVDALSVRLGGPGRTALVSVLAIPFVLAAELLSLALVFVLPLSLAIPVMLLVIAVIEELAKSLHVYAGFLAGRFEPRLASATVMGAASGFGFFVGEKGLLLLRLVGMEELELGRVALLTGGVPSAGLGAATAIALLAAPLFLHMGTSIVSSIGARGGRGQYLLGLAAAVAVHLGYNLVVVRLVL